MNFLTLVEQMVSLFLVILLGFIAQKAGILNTTLQKGLSSLVLSITMPALILSSVLNRSEEASEVPVLWLIGIGFAMILGRFLLSFPLTGALAVPQSQRGIYRFITTFSNLGFMGFPIISAIFGAEAVLSAAMFQIPFYLLSYTMGIRQIAGKHGQPPLYRSLLHPAVLSSLLAMVLYLTDLRLPSFVGSATQLVGQITTPAAMLIIGATLATASLKKAFAEWRLYPYSVITLVAFPLLTYAVLRCFTQDMAILGVTTVLAAMPAATNSTMFCHEYGGDAGLCSAGVFLSTLLSLLTVPLLTGWLFSA